MRKKKNPENLIKENYNLMQKEFDYCPLESEDAQKVNRT